MSNDIICCGVDDGFAETKIVLSSGQCIRIPSQGRAGELGQISINGGGRARAYAYQTSEGPFVVGEVDHSDSTSFDDYPVSALNRAIVTHALRLAEIPGTTQIRICTGLPVKRFYKGSAVNEALYLKKQANLLKNDVVASDGTSLPSICHHEVLAEGVAAWVDYVMQPTQNKGLQINDTLINNRIGIIDIGGRTTDIAVVRDWSLDTDRSSTLEVGMLDVISSVKEALYEQHEIELSDEQMHSAIKEKKVKMWGKWQDVSDLINRAQKSAMQRIEAEAKRCLGRASDIDQVIFVGGTVMAASDYLQGWFSNQEIAPNAAFANARGMLKFVEYTSSAG